MCHRETMMKALTAVLGILLLGASFAAGAQSKAAPAANGGGTHRYIVERTFPAGALDGLDAAHKAKVGVHWLMSYSNAAKTKTYCVYEGPSEVAIRKAATANDLPVDSVTEVPVTLLPK